MILIYLLLHVKINQTFRFGIEQLYGDFILINSYWNLYMHKNQHTGFFFSSQFYNGGKIWNKVK